MSLRLSIKYYEKLDCLLPTINCCNTTSKLNFCPHNGGIVNSRIEDNLNVIVVLKMKSVQLRN